MGLHVAAGVNGHGFILLCLLQDFKQPFGARPVFGRVDVLHPMPGQYDRRGGWAENHLPLQPSVCAAPVELSSIVVSLFKVLRAGVEVLGVEHVDTASGSDADGALDWEGVAGDRESVVAARLGQHGKSPAQIVRADKWGSGVEAADLFGWLALL